MANQRWYVARTKAAQERVALDNLLRQNFDAYFPQCQIERYAAGRIVTVREALFPRYVLIHLSDECPWRVINSTRGISRLVSFSQDGAPSPLPAGEVERLREREKSGQLWISEVLRFRKGDRVRLKVGLAVNQIGTVVRTRGERVELLLQLMKHNIRCIAPQHTLELVEGSGSAVAMGRLRCR
jgi:transcriptional antiterminator RfaH